LEEVAATTRRGKGAVAVRNGATLLVMLGKLADIGSALGGLATVILAVAAIIGGSAGLGDWRSKVRAQKALAEEERESIRLDRQRVLNGWSPNGLPVYGVTLVSEKDELARAADELGAGGPTDYVILRVSENTYGNANRARSLRQLVESGGYVTRPPEAGEYEALELGIKALAAKPASQGQG
jgi:hypothetical protein